jgi:hypothetical protein
MRKDLEALRESLPTMSRQELELRLTAARTDVKRFRAAYGAQLDPASCVRLAEQFRAGAKPGQYLYIPKWIITQNFTRWLDLNPAHKHLPEHARFALDIQGLGPPGQPQDLRILEAALYEDMASMFNRMFQLNKLMHAGQRDKVTLKEAAGCQRAVVSTAFYMIEAYLNSLAFDVVIQRGAFLSEKERAFLTEWDDQKDRPRFVAFREKLLHYPRIAVQAAHPIFQESNSPVVAFLLTEVRDLRDSIVHANPQPDRFEGVPLKEIAFWNVSSEYSTQVVDASISCIRDIDQAVHGHDRLFWLKSRNSDGFFDDVVFD